MKIFMALLISLLPVAASTQQLPTTIGTIPAKLDATLVFTSLQSETCQLGEFLMYILESTGQVRIWGCYVLDGNQLLVRYNDGDFYIYPLAALQPGVEWQRYAQEPNSAPKQ
jgi:hypothetical protein